MLEGIWEASLGPSSRLLFPRFLLLEALFLAFFLFFVEDNVGSSGISAEVWRGVEGKEGWGEEGGVDSVEDWAIEDRGELARETAGESWEKSWSSR